MKRVKWGENNYKLVLGAVGVLEQESDADNTARGDNLKQRCEHGVMMNNQLPWHHVGSGL